ncbi:MAG: HEAT repeat domain-containing protein [Deltaproteobacteria bacterium]|nr:HEAT repeat domain-containing protein [Deltaproteobacteria bacterium]
MTLRAFRSAFFAVLALLIWAGPAFAECAATDEACLLKALKKPGPDALRAIMALGEIKSEKAVDPLIAQFKSADPYAATAAAHALTKIGDAAVPALVEASKSKTAAVRKYAGYALGRIGGGNALAAVSRLAKDEDPEIRARAAQSFGLLKDKAALIDLVTLLEDRHRSVRLEAIRALSQMPDPKVVKPLIDWGLTDLDHQVSAEAAGVMLQIGPPAIDPLLATLDASPDHVRTRACLLLGELAAKSNDPMVTKQVRKRLLLVLKDEYAKPELRQAACAGLIPVGDAEVRAALEAVVEKYAEKTGAAPLVQSAKSALEKIPN